MAIQWNEGKQRFINPYNFVQLGKGVCRTDKPVSGELTGKIHCRLNVKTPLAIPDAESVKTVGEHKSYSFFRIDDKPIIPGSQIRGMIRSAYETLSDSCLSVNNVNVISARSPSNAVPGVIQYKVELSRNVQSQNTQNLG